MFFTKSKTYNLAISHERQNGYFVYEDPNSEWFISLGESLEEFKNGYGGVVWLCAKRYGGASACTSKLMYYSDKKMILIGDIESRIENKGYGSLMMQAIIKLARILKVVIITGNLSTVDDDHFDKLKHFYEKYGFNVDFDKMKIELRLN